MERLKTALATDVGSAPWDERGPVPRNVVERLQRIILDGALQPGDRLPAQRELADGLGVSRASLREALSVLETLGFVRVKPGLGVYVLKAENRAPVWRFSDQGSPRDVYQARICLEGFAVRLAAASVDERRLAELAASVDDLRQAETAGDLAGMAAADARFHDIIFDVCGNPVLAMMYKSVREVMVESQRLPLVREAMLAETVNEHVAILAAVAARDGEAASRLMIDHIRNAAGRYGIAL